MGGGGGYGGNMAGNGGGINQGMRGMNQGGGMNQPWSGPMGNPQGPQMRQQPQQVSHLTDTFYFEVVLIQTSKHIHY